MMMNAYQSHLEIFNKKIGCRVVRNSTDWTWNNQDGGDGHLGVVKAFESPEEAVIVWDNGTTANYRCGGYTRSFDLKIVDAGGATDFRHENANCDSCRRMPIYGFRWSCADCVNFDLCSNCYHNNKHNTKHQFYRTLDPFGPQILQNARNKSRRKPIFGILPGAKVIRGVDWQWDNQDGGTKGKVKEIKDWNEFSGDCAALIKWQNGCKNLYRLGFQGKIDLKVIKPAKGMSIYIDHLPFLGEENIPSNHY